MDATTSSSSTRRALNCLQFQSNEQNIVGRVNGQNSKQNITNPKLSFLETNDRLTKLKKRNSISLPDINLLLSSSNTCSRSDMPPNSSATSTPNNKSVNPKPQHKKMSSSKSNISIIFENEKENPNYMKAKLRNMENKINKKALTVKQALNETKNKTHEISIQCNKNEEDMVFSDSVKGTDYWRLIAHKRLDALNQTKIENVQLHKRIENLHEKNEELRANIKELYELIESYKELQKAALEEYEADDAEIDDSGYDVIQ